MILMNKLLVMVWEAQWELRQGHYRDFRGDMAVLVILMEKMVLEQTTDWSGKLL